MAEDGRPRDRLGRRQRRFLTPRRAAPADQAWIESLFGHVKAEWPPRRPILGNNRTTID